MPAIGGWLIGYSVRVLQAGQYKLAQLVGAIRSCPASIRSSSPDPNLCGE
ncbi:MAG: hypothetical protein ACJ74Y_07550 [Bryobacteraceae bacterium]